MSDWWGDEPNPGQSDDGWWASGDAAVGGEPSQAPGPVVPPPPPLTPAPPTVQIPAASPLQMPATPAFSDATVGATTARQPRSKGGLRRRIKRAVPPLLLLLASLGLLAGSIWKATRPDTRSAAAIAALADAEPAQPIERPDPVDVGRQTIDLPDVRGASQKDATAVLTEAGIAAEKIKAETVDWAGPAGKVVSQDPAPGTDNPEAVTIKISAAVGAPEVRGKPEQEAVDSLGALGSTAEVTRKYVPGGTIGTVVEQSPDPDAPLTEESTITVAVDGVAVPLPNLDPTTNDCSQGSVTIAGTDYDNGLYCTSGTTPATFDANLGGEFGEFSAVLGLADGTDPGTVLTVTISDGTTTLLTQPVSVGQNGQIKVPVVDKQRLVITVAGTTPTGSSARLLMGAPAVLADADVASRFNGGN